MFTNVSMTGTGIIIYVVGLVLSHFGVTVANDQVSSAVEGGAQLVGLVLTVWGQVRRQDLTLGLIRQ